MLFAYTCAIVCVVILHRMQLSKSLIDQINELKMSVNLGSIK